MKTRILKLFDFKRTRFNQRWKKYFSIGLLSLLFSAFAYLFFLKPAWMRYQELVNKGEKLKSVLVSKEKKIAFLKGKQEEFKRINKGFNQMLEQMVTQGELSDFLEFISKLGLSCSLSFDLFSPLAEINHDLYIEAPVSLILRGEYEQLLLFLSEISTLSPTVTLHDFEIKKLPLNEVSKTSKELLILKVTAKIYRHHG